MSPITSDQRTIRRRLVGLSCLFVWPRHWFSWAVGVVMAVAMVLIVVPGDRIHVGNAAGSGEHELDLPTKQEPTWPGFTLVAFASPPTPAPHLPYSVIEYSHGWPLEWLRTSRGYGGPNWPKDNFNYNRPSWMSAAAWPLFSQSSRIRLLPLAVDTGIVLLCVIGPALSVEHWRRRRGVGGRFRIVDGLGVMTAIAIVLGWWQYHARMQAAESRLLQAIYSQTNGFRFEASGGWEFRSSSYQGPVWLRKLLGGEFAVPVCLHTSYLRVDPALMAPGGAEQLADLPFLETIDLAVESYREVARCSRALRSASRLREIRLSFCLFHEEIALLANLPQVRKINIGLAAMTADELRELRASYPLVQFEEHDVRDGYGAEARMTTLTESQTAQDVCWKRIVRWSGDADVDHPWHGVDFRHFSATAERLRLLRPLCEETSEVIFGDKVDAQAAVEFVNTCPDATGLSFEVNFGGAEITPSVLRQLKPRRDQEISIILRQGNLKTDDFFEWARKSETVYFTVLGARFSPAEIQKLYDGFDDLSDWPKRRYCEIEAYASEADYEVGQCLPSLSELAPQPTEPDDGPFGGSDPFPF